MNGTLRSGAQGAIAYSVENHPNDSRVNIDESGKCQTLTSRMGTGGGNVPMVMEAFCKSGRGKFKGDAETWKDGVVANTLNTFDQGESRANELVVEKVTTARLASGRDVAGCLMASGYEKLGAQEMFSGDYTVIEERSEPAVAYGISSYDSNAMKSSNPHSGIYEATTSRTLDLNGGNPACNQGGIAIVEPTVYALDQQGGKSGANHAEDVAPTMCADSHGTPHAVAYCTTTGSYMQVTENQSPTLMARDYKDPNVVCYGLDRASFNQGANAQFSFSILPEQQPTLTAKGPGAVCSRYIVRRLTPTECARLQGFPDTWGHPPQKDSLTDEEYAFWQKVRNTHATINGRAAKEYTKAQMLSWYNKLHTDSSEYKMWGNGIALPNALYVMQGIADELEKAKK